MALNGYQIPKVIPFLPSLGRIGFASISQLGRALLQINGMKDNITLNLLMIVNHNYNVLRVSNSLRFLISSTRSFPN